MNTADVHALYAYNRWANRRMFSVLEKLSDEQFRNAMQSSFPSMRESVLHIVAAEWLWLKRWKGASPRATVADTSNASAMGSALSNGGVAVETLATSSGLQSFADSIEQERQEFLEGGIADSKIVVRRNGIEVPAQFPRAGSFRNKWRISKEAKLILFLGRLVSKKSPDLMLQVFSHWTDGANERLESLARLREQATQDGLVPIEAAHRTEGERARRRYQRARRLRERSLQGGIQRDTLA